MRAIPSVVRSAIWFALLALVVLIAAVYFLTAPASVATVPVGAATAATSAATVPAGANTVSKSVAAAVVGTAASSKAVATPAVSAAAAPKSIVVVQNLCVHGADGAIVCGPVAERGGSSAPSPFDRPGVAQPVPLAPGIAEPPPARHRTVRSVERHMRAPKHVYHRPHPRELERHPPRRIAHEDARRWYHEDARHLHTIRDPRAPLRIEGEPPVHHSAAERRRESERASRRAEREYPARRYADRGPPPPPRLHREQAVQFADLERRTRALEQELRVLRAERNAALRQAERRDAGRPLYRKPPPRHRAGETRYEPEPSSVARRAAHRPVDRYRRSVDD